MKPIIKMKTQKESSGKKTGSRVTSRYLATAMVGAAIMLGGQLATTASQHSSGKSSNVESRKLILAKALAVENGAYRCCGSAGHGGK